MEDINLFGANPLRVVALTLAVQNLPGFGDVGDLLASAEEILTFLTGETKGPPSLFTDSESYGTASATFYDAGEGSYGNWIVADGKAYYQGPDGKYSKSFFSPEVLASQPGVRYVGVFEIARADLVGIEGTP